MNINEMTDQEKSVMLAQLVGWRDDGTDEGLWIDENGETIANWTSDIFEFQLYDPANMMNAWRVLNWWNDEWKKHNAAGWAIDLLGDNDEHIFGSPPQEAVMRILDTVLMSAIEAGMVPEETK